MLKINSEQRMEREYFQFERDHCAFDAKQRIILNKKTHRKLQMNFFCKHQFLLAFRFGFNLIIIKMCFHFKNEEERERTFLCEMKFCF